MVKGGKPASLTPLKLSPRDDAAQLRLIADNVPAMSTAYDEKLICLFASRRFAEFFGLTTRSIVGKHLRDVIGEAAYQEVKPNFDRVLAGHRTTYKRTRVMENGERRYLEVELIPHFAEDARVRGFFSLTTDVTERTREEQLRTLGLSVAALIAHADSSTTAIRAVMRTICEAEGWDCGRYHRRAAGGERMEQVEAWGIDDPAVQRFLERGRSIEHRPGVGLTGIVWESGEPLWVADASEDPRALLRGMTPELSLRGAFHFPVKSDGQIIGILSFNSRDRREPDERLLSMILGIGNQIGQFLERKHAEERLRDSEGRFRTVVESANEGIIVYDRDTNIASVNGAAARILGVPEERLVGAPGFVSLLPCIREDGAPVTTEGRSAVIAMRTRAPITGRVIGIRRPGGEITWINTNTALLYEPGSAEPYGAVMALSDITRLKREEALLRLEQRIAQAFDQAKDAPTALAAAMQAVCEAEGWEVGRYLEVAGGMLRHFTHWGLDEPLVQRYLELSRNASYRPGVGLLGAAWQTRQAIWVSDVREDARAVRRLIADELGVRATLTVPVLVHDEVIGVFIFQSRRVRAPDERLLQAMQLMGGQIGQLVRRAKAEAAVRESEARFRSLCNLSSDVFWEQDAEFRFTSISDASGALDSEALIGRRRWELEYGNLKPEDWAEHRALLEAHQPFRDLELCRPDRFGREAWYSVSGEPVFDGSGTGKEAGRFTGYRGVGRNITTRKLDERRIRHLASHDTLTGLPNRTAFSELLNAARENARRHGRSLAVMFVDLDRFKVINDTLGHETGDYVLTEAARRLRHTLRASDVVARLGGDEFVVMIPEVSDGAHAETAARKVLAALAAPMQVGSRELTVTGSVGICLYPQDGDDEQALMKNADAAMYRAKEAGKNNYKFHSGASDRRALERLAMETSLRRGVEREQFFLHYQPRVSLRTGAVSGLEALVRWRHPELGVVPPGEFIALAEETGCIGEIGRWVLGAACAQAARWRREGLAPLAVAVNVSARQFANDDLVAQVRSALESHGLEPRYLELEITESVMVQNVERAAQVLAGLRALGVRIALDDFGTGYSSLAHLKRFPIDTLKVDRAFVAGLPENADDAAIARAIIAMGRSLRLVVVAEGVETSQQHAFLQAQACDEVQGFLLSPPLSAEDCAQFVRRASKVLQ